MLASWIRHGLVAGALIGVLEGLERAYAVRGFAPGPAGLAAFAGLAFVFCAFTGAVLGAMIGAVAALLAAAARSGVPGWAPRVMAGGALGALGGAWFLFALSLTARLGAVVGRPGVVIGGAAVAGALVALAWPWLTGAWNRLWTVRAVACVLGAGLAVLFVLLHLWNAHFAPQSSLGIHLLADTALAMIAVAIAMRLPLLRRGRGLAIALVAIGAGVVWTDRVMRTDPLLENLIKTRGSISAHAIRMWSGLLDLDRDGFASPWLTGGDDPGSFDPSVPGPLLATADPAARPADSLAMTASAASAMNGAPHLVLLTLDACRLDVVPPSTAERSRLGDLLPPRPALERLAGRVARFLVGYTPSAGTEDTFAAMFSGWDLPGILSGVPAGRWVGSRLAAAGYEVRGFANDPHFGVSSFDSQRLRRYPLADGFRMLDDAAAFLDSLPPGRPGFAWIHVMDLHADILRPFSPETFSHRAHLEFYARALARVDSMVGAFVAALDSSGQSARTVLVMTADHGEELGGHGHYHHNLSLYQPAIRVPLWIMGPGIAPGEYPARVSLQAIYPTLLEAAGLEPHGAAGRSLWPTLTGQETPHSDPWIYSYLPQRGISPNNPFYRPELGQATLFDAVRRRKVILRLGLGSWEAYDVAADSMEVRNLAGRAAWADTLRERLEIMIRERRTAPPQSGG